MTYTVPERCEFHIGDIFDGKYKVERKLGEGTFGIVYKVSDNSDNVFAAKLLKLWTVETSVCKNLKDRFKMEFETGQIKSEHLARSYSYGEIKGNPYILMEFCSGGDLKDYADRHRDRLIEAGCDVLCGLRDLHAHGKVHRDLKPENVLMRADNRAVLTDFGISGDQNKRMTERGMFGRPQQIFGTYPYMPPEQGNPPHGGQATVLPTTDIFSFGVMMYELLVGSLPFGELREETLHIYLENGKMGRWDREALKRVDGTGVWLPVIEGCLKPNFKERLQSADQVLKMLPATTLRRAANAGGDAAYMTVVNGILLRVMQGEEYGKTIRLKELLKLPRRLLTVGRNDPFTPNDVVIHENLSSYISRRHSTLQYDDVNMKWYIRDGQWINNTGSGHWQSSLNGTYVNSTQVSDQGMEIRPGDIISMGDVKLRVEGY